MAVIKVFDSFGVKTVAMMGNLDEQPYDESEDAEEIVEDKNPFE